MFVVNTAEIRWFYKGDMPVSFKKWFSCLDGYFEDQEERIDHYFCMPDQSKLGIKLREGRFEIKKLIFNEGILSSKSAEGIVDAWKKWSFKADEQEGLSTFKDEPEHWIDIRKKRLLQKYVPDAIETWVPAKKGPYPSEGMNVELCNVVFSGIHYWTFGMESYGPESRTVNLLRSGFRKIFFDPPPLPLALEQSLSYPEWLCVLPHQK
ncbi:MAG: hypothetical protein KQI35_05550 [Bacteroidetes bacterium]|nr:hypothetical protein [Bacteroidota bacterium]